MEGECFSGPKAGETYNKYGKTKGCPDHGKGSVWEEALQVYEML